MSVVVDCSIALAWFLKDEHSEYAERVLAKVSKVGGLVPALFHWEFANGLKSSVRRGRMTGNDAIIAVDRIHHWHLMTDLAPESVRMNATLRLAIEFDLTVYDAAYLQLAQERGLPLATLDKKLAAIAAAQGIELFQ